MKQRPKAHRTFSAAFKKEKVNLIDQGQITVRELSRLYEVSETSVYNWRKKYSKLDKTERIVVEKVSEAKKNIELLGYIRDLEQTLGKKQLELDYYRSVINVVSEEAGEDILKKYKPRQ